MENPSVQDILAFQTRRVFNVIAKRMLIFLEDMKQNHAVNFTKLKEAIPEFEYLIRQADYFDDQQFAYCRKKMLDIVNEGFRELEAEMNKVESTLK